MPQRLSLVAAENKFSAGNAYPIGTGLQEYQAITEKACHYCGKKSDPPRHYNGLDRLDSTIRVYDTQTCVAACGTCNVAKFRFSVSEFLDQCYKVAVFQHSSESRTET